MPKDKSGSSEDRPEATIPAEYKVREFKPAVGRVVHYVNRAEQHHAAIVTALRNDGSVDLIVFTPNTAGQPALKVTRDEGEKKPFTFHEPERE